MDTRPGLQEHRPHLETNRKRIFVLRFERLRVESCDVNDFVDEARGLWSMPNIEGHITFKKLKATRYFTQAFLPKGRRLVLYEDNQSIVGVLAHLTSKSPTMMCELRDVFLLIDTYDIQIRT